MIEEDVEDELFLNLCQREHISDWLNTRQSRDWASNELPCLPAPSFQSDERPLLLNTLADDEKALVLLENQVKELRQKVSKLRAQLSPIRLAPPEIIARIFYYVASEKNAIAYAFNSPLPPIIAVCKQWRIIAREASLWDAIPISGKPRVTSSSVIIHPPPETQPNNERLRAWLALSRAPLDIFQEYQYTENAKLADWSALFDTPRPWKHFKCSSPELIRRFISGPLNLANMVTLHLGSYDDVLPRNLEMEFPKLKEIYLWGGWVPSALAHLKAPRVYSVTICDTNLETEHTTCLSQNFPTVVKLLLHCVQLDHAISPPFTHLENLSWTSDEGDYSLSVFQSSPRLCHLDICSTNIDTVHVVLLQSVTTLRLSWWDVYMSEPTARSLLAAVPQLSELHLYNDPTEEYCWLDASDILRLLLPQNPMLCPKLQRLSLQYIRVPEPELLKTVSFLRSGREIPPDPSRTSNSEGDSSPPAILLVTLNWCGGPQDVKEANYEELCSALGEYYFDDELSE